MILELTFWGVRGSFPVSGEAYKEGGGNTCCVSVFVNQQHLIVFDAGSGLYDLNKAIASLPTKTIHFFLSHLHLDHIMGLPFFKPVWNPDYKLSFYSLHNNLKKFLCNTIFNPVLFPKQPNSHNAQLAFNQISINKEIEIDQNVVIKTLRLHHPGGAVGYRLEAGGKSISYITDVEHDPAHLDQDILDFIEGTDLFIYDSTYTEEEFEEKRGWGHSTYTRGAELAKEAQVKQMALYHHNPSHDDQMLNKMEAEAQTIFKNTIAARQGMKIRV